MSKHRLCVFLCLGVIMSALGLHAQDTLSVVAVRPLESGQDVRLGHLAEAVQNTIVLVLQLLGRYKVVAPSGLDWTEIGTSAEAAEKHDLDNVITGSIKRGEDKILIELSVFSRLENKTVLNEKGAAESIFDVFDVTDRLTLRLLEAFTQEHITFGELMLRNYGVERDYIVMIDGKELGQNLTAFRRILTGDHQLHLYEKLGDTKKSIISKIISIQENKTATVDFAIPSMYEDEVKKLNELDFTIITRWNNSPAASEVTEALEAAQAYLSGFADRDVTLLADKYEFWKKAFHGREVALSSGPAKNTAARLMAQKKRWRDSRFAEPLVAHRSVDTFLRDTAFVPHRKIKVDGRLDDWEGIEPIFVDKEGDKKGSYTGTDIVRGYLAKDAGNLYLRMDFADGKLTRKKGIIYEIRIKGDRTDSGGKVFLEFRIQGDGRKLGPLSFVVKYDPDKSVKRYEAARVAIGPGFFEAGYRLSGQLIHMQKDFRYSANMKAWIAGSTREWLDDTEEKYISLIE